MEKSCFELRYYWFHEISQLEYYYIIYHILGMYRKKIWIAQKHWIIVYRLFSFYRLSTIKWGNQKSIFFIICQIFAIFDDFSKFHNVLSTFHSENLGEKWKKPCPEFFLAINWNFQQNWLRKVCNFDDLLGWDFYSLSKKMA